MVPAKPVIVVGAGPAGIRAAQVLVEAGLRPVLFDEARTGGGQIYRRQPEGFRRGYAELYGTEADKARAVHDQLDALKLKLDYRPGTLAWGLNERVLHVVDENGAGEALPFESIIIAAGATDRIFPVPGWTEPGVFTLGAAQISLKSQACAIGQNIVFMGTGPLLYLVAYQHLKAGAKPVAVLDTSSLRDRIAGFGKMAARPGVLFSGLKYMLALKRAGVPMLNAITPTRIAAGEAGVSAVEFLDKSGAARSFSCDAVAFGYHLRAETQLAELGGVPFVYNDELGQFLPVADHMGRTPVAGLYLAGDGMQLAGADGAEASGRLAAFALLQDRGIATNADQVRSALDENRLMRRFRDGLAQVFPWPGKRLAATLPDDTVVCRCEQISAGNLRLVARALGGEEINRAKALSRVGMGRCQGRYCGIAAAEIIAAELDVSTASVGRLRAQAPVKPLPAAIRTKR